MKYVLTRTILIAIVLSFGITLADQTSSNSLSLIQPEFIVNAAQNSSSNNGASFLEKEAGISAYIKVNQTIDLEKIKAAFKSLEVPSTNYLVGEVEIPKLPEHIQPHVYVNADGWIVAYYSAYDPASKIIEWIRYSEKGEVTTTLSDAIGIIYGSLGLAAPAEKDIAYYNFKYPDANRILMVYESFEPLGNNAKDGFYLTAPSGITRSVTSWSLYRGPIGWGYAGVNISVDGTEIARLDSNDVVSVGDFSSSIKTDFRHRIDAAMWCNNCPYSGVGVVMIYKN